MIPVSVAALLTPLVFLGGLFLGFVTARLLRPRPNIGETLVARTIAQEFQQSHVLFNDLTLVTDEGATQIDHVAVATTGIFVIETKHYSGWIFGRFSDAQWTQVIFKTKNRFQNPVRQNYGHVKALQALLNLPDEAFIPLVVFTSSAEFKTDLGPSVLKLSELTRYLSTERPTLFDERTMAYLIGRIEMARLPRCPETTEYHVNYVRRRLGASRS